MESKLTDLRKGDEFNERKVRRFAYDCERNYVDLVHIGSLK